MLSHRSSLRRHSHRLLTQHRVSSLHNHHTLSSPLFPKSPLSPSPFHFSSTTPSTRPSSLFSYGHTSIQQQQQQQQQRTYSSKIDEIAAAIEKDEKNRQKLKTSSSSSTASTKTTTSSPDNNNNNNNNNDSKKEDDQQKKKKKSVDLTPLLVTILFILLYASKRAKDQMHLPSVHMKPHSDHLDQDQQQDQQPKKSKNIGENNSDDTQKTQKTEQENEQQFNDRPPVRIAIVGSGISGASTAYYTKHLLENVLKQRVEVTVYEKSLHRVGGRLRHVEIGGVLCEVGGSHIIRDNYYAMRVLNSLNLHLGPQKKQILVIWDDDEQRTIFVEDVHDTAVNRREYVQRYQLGWAAWRTNQLMKDLFLKFCKVYELQKSEKFFVPREFEEDGRGDVVGHWLSREELQNDVFTWETVSQYVDASRLQRETRETFYEHFCASRWPLFGIQERFLREIVEPIIRVNYSQNTSDVTAFAGGVATAGVFSDFRPIREGTSSIVSAMLHDTKSNVKLGSTVKEIVRCGDEEQQERYVVKSSLTRPVVVDGKSQGVEQVEESAEYDYVIVATPLEHTEKPILFTNVQLPETMKYRREYRSLHSTFVVGHLNLDHFKVKDQRKQVEAPKFFDQIAIDTNVVSQEETGLTTPEYGIVTVKPNRKEQALFNSISPIGRTNDTHLPIYKIFSTQPVTNEQIDQFFKDVKHVEHYSWSHGAYPMLKVYEDQSVLPPIKINDHLYYASAFESIVSTMETNLINAKNVAFMIGKSVIGQMEKEELEAKRKEMADEDYTE